MLSIIEYVRTKKNLIIAHRGAAANDTKNENTIKAFMNSIAGGADMIELDVNILSDGCISVQHDYNISTQNALNLDSVLNEIAHKIYLIIEIKPMQNINTIFINELIALLTKHNVRHECVIASFDEQIISYIQNKDNDLITAIITEKHIENIEEYCKKNRYLGVIMPLALLKEQKYHLSDTENVHLGVYGVNSDTDFDYCEKNNIKFIGTDNPIYFDRANK